ncbi:MAG: TonB-dependent receptor [Acidobacteria bacterium]|nr:TonB-dependent receptor [Acidobacteriota bacterium]MBI3422838.1 TonB-dependent receptor [Acidobacteriota bacterium]
MKPLLRSLVFLVACSFAAFAQVSSGTITGTVRDANDAVIAGAKVKVTQTATSVSRETVSDERGQFLAPNLRPGEYSITVTATGFQGRTFTGIILAVDQTLNLSAALQPGAVEQSIEVTAAAPLLDSSTSSLGQVIDNKKIIDLPLNGRNPFALGLLTGFTAPVKGVASNLPFIGGGGRWQNNDVLLDGVDNNTMSTGGGIGVSGINYIPSVDAVAEFKVKTNNYSAEFGRSAGTIISATTKSGTNQYHGTAWEFLRNEKFDANNFFTNAAPQPVGQKAKRSPFKQNQFGATFGGPVWVPKAYDGHGKTFFFVDYEGLRRRTSASSSLKDVPPTAFRNGDFSAFNRKIYDPRTRRLVNGRVVADPFPNNIIPTNLLNPGAVATLKLLPEPNFGAAGAQAANYLFLGSQPFDSNQYDIRVDHQINDKNTIFGRYSRALQTSVNPGNFTGFIGGGTDNLNNSVHTTINDTHVFSPNIVNEARIGYSRHNGSFKVAGIDDGLKFAETNNIAVYPFPIRMFPNIVFSPSGLTSGSNSFTALGSGGPNLNIENNYQASDDLTWRKVSHTFKMGMDVRRRQFDVNFGGGQTVFGSIFSSSSGDAGSGNPLADFLLGYPSQVTGTQLLDWARMRDSYFGAYFQDDWKVNSKLTLNLGVRYERFAQPTDARDRGSLFDTRTGKFVVPGQNGYSRAIVEPFNKNFAPRFGFAYNWSSRLTVRGGAGVFYGQRSPNQQTTVFGSNPPNAPAVITPTVSANATVTPPMTISTPIQVGPATADLSTFTPTNSLGLLIRTADFTNSRPAQLYQWNLGLQYQLTKDTLLEAAYAATRGTRLTTRVNLNQIPWERALAGFTSQADRLFPNVGNQVVMDSAMGNNHYHALNLRAEKRLSYGLNFLVNYTWSKNLESGSGGNSAMAQNGGTTNPLDSWNLRKEKSVSAMDLPYVFVVSSGYELPFGKGKPFASENAVARALLGGWQLNGIFVSQSGFPTDIRSSRVAATNQLFATFSVPDLVLGQSLYLPKGGPDGYFNPAAFAEPGTVTNAKGVALTKFGTLARRAGRGPSTNNVDFSVFRVFSLREKMRLQFRTEVFNLTNTPSFFLPSAASPALTIGNPNFGKLTASSATGRQIQFGLKLVF